VAPTSPRYSKEEFKLIEDGDVVIQAFEQAHRKFDK
jgi:hypothetical protein